MPCCVCTPRACVKCNLLQTGERAAGHAHAHGAHTVQTLDAQRTRSSICVRIHYTHICSFKPVCDKMISRKPRAHTHTHPTSIWSLFYMHTYAHVQFARCVAVTSAPQRAKSARTLAGEWDGCWNKYYFASHEMRCGEHLRGPPELERIIHRAYYMCNKARTRREREHEHDGKVNIILANVK